MHDFRCKTKGGDLEIGHYRYVISKNFKEIILWEDKELDKHKERRKAIESVLNGWEEMKIINL